MDNYNIGNGGLLGRALEDAGCLQATADAGVDEKSERNTRRGEQRE